MPVMFKTQQGRTLRRHDLTVDDIGRAVRQCTEVIGYEHPPVGYLPGVLTSLEVEFHVNGRHIVEWWDSPWRAPVPA